MTKINPILVFMSPTWFNRNCGFDYSEESWRDPVERVERNREQERAIYDRFGDVGMGSKDPEPSPVAGGAYGNYFMPALFGCQILYPKDQAPGFSALQASFEDMKRLQVPDFQTSPVMRRLRSEAEVLHKRYGKCGGFIDTGSPLNVAVNIYGEIFLAACALEPATAQHVLRTIAETIFKLYREFMSVWSPEQYPLPEMALGYGNCPAVMLSPQMYEEVVLPVDLWVRRQLTSFYLHHCGVFDKYIDVYRQLEPNGLDIGGGSDYRVIREAFPDIKHSLIVNPPDIEGKSSSHIDGLVGDMVENAGPPELISQLWTPEVSEQIEDDTVRALRTVNERI